MRSSSSSVLRWPDRGAVHAALTSWAGRAAAERPRLLRAGYIGSYARGDWGVGSDLDVVLVVAGADRPFRERGVDWDLTPLPVPAELLVFTIGEWARRVSRGDRFSRTLKDEAVWVWESDEAIASRGRH